MRRRADKSGEAAGMDDQLDQLDKPGGALVEPQRELDWEEHRAPSEPGVGHAPANGPDVQAAALPESSAPHASQVHGVHAALYTGPSSQPSAFTSVGSATSSSAPTDTLPSSPSEHHQSSSLGGSAVGERRPAPLPDPEFRPRWSKARWVGWFALMAFIGVLVGGVAVAYLKFIDGPSEGVTAKSLTQVKASVAPKPTPPNLLSGLLIEFQYPATFDTVGQLKTDAQATEQYNISSKTSYERLIAVSVRPLPSSNLDDDSSYRFRQLNTAEYRMSQEKMAGESAALLTKLDHQEQTLFWAHQGHEVTIAVTSSSTRDNVEAIMKTVIQTLRWRR